MHHDNTEKVKRKKKSKDMAWQPIDRVKTPRSPRLHRIRGQRGVLVHVDIPGVSLNIQDPLLRLTANRWPSIGQVSSLYA